MQTTGYFDSPWPCEDAGPARIQAAANASSLNLEAGASLQATSRRTHMSTMTVLGAPGEVFLLTHSVLRSHLGFPSSANVSLIDPITLKTVRQSVPLAGGPMWPGGMAVHANGSLIVVYGRYAHKLDRQCNLLKSYLLPIHEAYNSFVVLDNGLVVTKNLSSSTPAQLTTLNPETFKSACNDVICPEASIARLSAIGNTVYVVGVSHVWRYHWHDASQRLVRDTKWQCHYLQNAPQSYAWDMVIEGDHGWLMDNGQHNYLMSMLGAGQNKSPNRLIRISLKQSDSFQTWPVSGLPFGSVTNPPLVDVARRIVVGFDSANRHLKAWRMISSPDSSDIQLEALWHLPQMGAASHMLLFPNSGELCVNDYERFNEQVMVLDIETGREKSRVRTGGWMQGVVFPSPGWHNDFYWCSMDRLTRIFQATPRT
jgi:hypothetical protein